MGCWNSGGLLFAKLFLGISQINDILWALGESRLPGVKEIGQISMGIHDCGWHYAVQLQNIYCFDHKLHDYDTWTKFVGE